MFIHERGRAEKTPFDFTGFALLSVAIAAFQLFLDRGPTLGWFESSEIVIEAAVAGVAFLMFVIQILGADRPFVPRALLTDRARVTIEVLDSGKRPVAAVADHDEVRSVRSVEITMDHKVAMHMLFDPGHSLDERILREQFGY